MNIQFDAETLRYFYSSVFQGFAALLSLGIVVFTIYIQKIEYQLSALEQSYHQILVKQGGSSFQSFVASYNNFYEFCTTALNGKAGLSNDYFSSIKPIISRYVKYNDIKRNITISLKWPIISCAVILSSSITLLLLIDNLNYTCQPIILLALIFWSLIEIIFAIKFSLEFKILKITRIEILNKTINLFNWAK
jgi:hypothetical protein